jgi:hypothetical protein
MISGFAGSVVALPQDNRMKPDFIQDVTVDDDTMPWTGSVGGSSRGSHCHLKAWRKQNEHLSSVTGKVGSLRRTDLMSRRSSFDFSTRRAF